MRRLKPQLTLGRKLYAVAVLLAALAVALASNAFIPLAKSTAEVGQARSDVGQALNAQATGRQTAAYLWHLGALAVIDTDEERAHVREARVAADAATQDWIDSERRASDVRVASRLHRLFETMARDGERVIAAVDAGDERTARMLVDDVYATATERYAFPLDSAIRHEDSEMREAFVRLAGRVGTSGSLASGRLMSHVLAARTRAELAVAASGFIRLRLVHGQVLAAALVDPERADLALTSVMDLVATGELDTWRGNAFESDDSPTVSAVAAVRATDGRLSVLTRQIVGRLRAGDIASARALFAEEFGPTLETVLGDVESAIDSYGTFSNTSLRRIVIEHRQVAAVMALFAVIVLVLAFTSALIARRLARRLTVTTKAVRSFATGEFEPIVIDGNDELTELADAFNSMSADVLSARDGEKRFLQRTVEATESERMQLAAELHDGPIQRLTGLLYGLERAGARVARGESDGLEDFMDDARDKVASEVGALRHLLSELRPPALDQRGLDAAVVDYLSDFARREGVECDVDIRLDERVSESLETTMYRILQEALANVSKHAAARRVGVALWNENNSVRLSVVDDGRGFDLSDRSDNGGDHFGVVGMTGRAQYAGGSLEIDSAPGKGTVVCAMFPTTLRKAS